MRPRTYDWSRTVRASAFAALLALTNAGPSSLVVAQSGPPPPIPLRGLIDHVSANPDGRLPATTVETGPHAISGDGRYVVMNSYAWDLVTDDLNWDQDVFLRDRMTGTTTRSSVADDGSEANGGSGAATISANGRHVAFASGASNLVAGDTNSSWDVFVRDLDRGRTVRVSVATGGAQGNRDAYWPVISADGRFVVFTSGASNLVPAGQPNLPMQAYVHDRDADSNGIFDEEAGTSTTLASVSVSGGFADSYTDNVRVSGDGRFVLFESSATNLDPAGNPNQSNHLYVRDRQAGVTTLIDRAVTGGPSSWGVGVRTSDMSDDARYVTYASMSSDIVPFDMNGQSQVFRYDRNADPFAQTSLVSALPDGTLADGSGFATSVSADGRLVAFTTTASNLASPPPAQGALVVRDMVDGTFTRVDVIDTGAGFNHAYPYSPAISADGTAVALMSDARNAVGGQYSWGNYHVFVATGFSANPAFASYPVAGGSGSVEVNATAVSGWSALSRDWWIVLADGIGFGAGPRTVQYNVEPNETGIARNGRIRLGSMMVSIHQDSDGDTTPPDITPIVTGTLGGDGWYVGDVTVQWTVTDPESLITDQSYNCDAVTTIDVDAIYAPVTCEATSHGGASSNTVVIRRDTTAPTIDITTPAATGYVAGSTVEASYTCSDVSDYSGVATCAMSQGSSPLDTTPGRHVFAVTATDLAGNSETKSVEYLVGTGACVLPNDSLKAWWRFEANTYDALGNLYGAPTPFDTLQYAPGLAGQSYQGQSTTYLDTNDWDRLLAWNGLTVAAWVKPTGQIGESATIVSKPAQYRIARYPDGTLRWAFSQTTGFAWVDTGVVIPGNVWTHIAVSYDAGLVKTYVNGRLAHTQQLSGTLTNATDWSESMTIGGRTDASAFYFGWLDELEIFTSPLTAAEIEAIALAGNGGVCEPTITTLTVSVPATVGYGATFPATATLRDGSGAPIAGKTIAFHSHVSPGDAYAGAATGTTDEAGQVQAAVPMSSSATLGSYALGVTAVFAGDARDTPAQSSSSSVTVVRGTPALTWPSPSPIVYGTALGSGQLNATGNTDGTFTYAPAAGTILGAESQTLTVTFTPSDVDRWEQATATTTVLVNKATPTVTITGGAFTYDTLPHPGVASATGALGEALSPVQIYYNNTSQSAPVSTGFNWVSAYYAGSANYTTGFASNVPLVINKAVPTVTIAGGPFTYNGGPHQVSVTVRGAGNDFLSPYALLYDGGANPPVQAGTHTVHVQYDGDFNYEAAAVDRPLVITQATPIMSLVDVTLTYDGQPHGVAVNVAGVNNEWLTPVAVTYDGSPTVPTGADVYAIEARYDGSSNYNAISRAATLTILKAAPYVTWTTPASIVYGTELGATELNATANVAGGFTYSPAAGTALSAGTHSLDASFTPTDIVNYQTASASVTLIVGKTNSVITWTPPAAIVYGTPLSAAQLSATANVPGTFAYSPAVGTVLNAGSRSLSVTFTPTDEANYTGATTAATVIVMRAASTITWPAPVDIAYGTALGGTQLNATASVPGTFTYSPAAGTKLSAGSYVLSATFTPSDAANYTGSSATRALTVARAPLTIFANNSSKPYGAPLPPFSATGAGFVNSDSMASLTGALSFTTSATAASPVGTYPVTPQGVSSSNYAITFASGTLTVVRALSATSVVTSPNPDGLNQAVTLTAAVSVVPPGAGSPAGIMRFFDGGTLLGSVSITSGSASLTTNGLSAGSHAMSATYTGDASFAPSSGTGGLTVNSASSSSTTTVTSSANPATVGANVTLTATVSAPGGLGGNVAFYDGTVSLGTVPLSGTTARFTTATLALRGHAITARYLGNAAIPPSTSPAFAQYIRTAGGTTRGSTVVLTASPSPATLGSNVTLTATVTGSNQKEPTGQVTFMLNGSVLGQGTLTTTGNETAAATLSAATLPYGTHWVEAVYLGDATFRASTTSITLVVNAFPGDRGNSKGAKSKASRHVRLPRS